MLGFAFQPTTDNQQPSTVNKPLAQLDGASVWECFPALAVSIVCVGDDDKLTELISKTIDVALQSRLYDDEKYVDKIVGFFTELANMYNTVTANCNKNAETLNRNIQLTEKRYAAMMVPMQAKKSKTIEQPPIPQTMKALPRFVFLTYPWYWIKRMYRSEHFRQFLVICMACLLAVSVFLTIFLAYDNAQLRKEICRKCYTLTQ